METPRAELAANTHVHVPPNFSAFDTVSDAVASARREGMRAVGVSNFYDQSVYARFETEARAAGIVPLFGLEFITRDEGLAERGVRVNDPANPGRVYLCGKGINPLAPRSEHAQTTARAIREANDERAERMLATLQDYFRQQGAEVSLNAEDISREVAQRAEVPTAWVSLQERHIARAVYDAVDDPELLYGQAGEPASASEAQGVIRSRFLKAGTPGFVPEVPLSFADAHRYILDMQGIPTYPILADGAPEMSEVEWPPDSLIEWLREREIHAVELIPNRNASEVVDRYVRELSEAGFIVMAGTEHNTNDRIPVEPRAADGALGEGARAVFYDAACVIAAHQARCRRGEPGYVDATGKRAADLATLIAEGARLLERGGGDREAIARIAPRLRGAFATEDGPAVVVADPARDRDDYPSAAVLEYSTDDAALTDAAAMAAREGSSVVVVPDVAAFGIGTSVAAARAALAGRPAEEKRPTGRLAGKVAVVTGAAQGFGLGITEELLADGATVILADLNVPLAAANAERLNATFGADRALAVRIDVGDERSCLDAAAEVAQLTGGVDLFVSNAGVLRAESVLTQPVADFDLVTAVNYRGYFLTVRAFAPLMVSQHATDPSRWLDIVEVNSKSGLEGSKRNFAYAGSKFGGIGLTQSFALELVEYGIKVNAVCPGNYLDGPLWMDPERGLFVQYLRAGKVPGATSVDDVRAFYEAKVPMGRGCLPKDLARAIVYITEQSYETGQALPVTGGQNMLN